MENISVTGKDLYQLLIAECRYGYTRNNHLMPSDAYNHVYLYLPKVAAIDQELAISIAKQLCEECISLYLSNTSFIDEYTVQEDNNKAACRFIDYLIKYVNSIAKFEHNKWVPYNYNIYQAFLQKENECIYNIYETAYCGPGEKLNTDNVIGSLKLTNTPIQKNQIITFLIENIIKENTTITYRKYFIGQNHKYLKIVFDDLKLAYLAVRE